MPEQDRRPAVRAALAALLAQVLDDLAEVDGTPRFEVMPDYEHWSRQSQESFLALRRDAWRMPERVPILGWLDRSPQMAAVRAAIAADPVMGARVDCPVGVEFSLQSRQLVWLLIEQLLEPMVRDTRSYRFDEAVFDRYYRRLEAGLLAEQVRLVEFVPLNAFTATTDVGSVPLAGGLVLREMSDSQLSAAIGHHAVPAEFAGGTNSVTVSRFHQWALTSERAYPIVSYKLGMPAQPVAPPFPSLTDPADRLVAALRLVCAGSVVATRAIRRQHDDDFPLIPGSGAILSAVPAADYTRSTLLTGDQVEAVQRVYAWLEQQAVAADRNLQKALRRLVLSGSHGEATERLTDLMVCAEVLLLKRNGYTGRTKSAEIADRIEALLATDTALGVPGSQLRQFMTDAYRVRNAEMHGDDPATLQLRRLDGAPAGNLVAVVEDVERVMRGAVRRVVAEVAGCRSPSLATT